MQMGQFLDHDFAHSPNFDAATCCSGGKRDEQCIPIEVFRNDTYFSGNQIPKARKTCMPMARAMTAPSINCELDSERQQVTYSYGLFIA